MATALEKDSVQAEQQAEVSYQNPPNRNNWHRVAVLFWGVL